MRAIDADAAKNKYLAAIKELLKATTTNLGDDAISLLAGSSIIDNAPTIDVHSKWVSVNDRLPEVDRPVLVYAIGKLDWLIGRSKMVITTMSDRNWFDCNIKVEPYWVPPWQYFTTDYEITHWRYLPDPPKEEDDARTDSSDDG